MEPWYKRTFLWGQVNLTEDDPEKCDVDFWKEYWKKARVEGVIINCGGIVSYYQSRFSYQYRAKSLGERDYFGVWNQAARKQGLIVIARMDINSTAKEMYERYPSWYCRDKDGRPIMSQGRYVACVNGGYYQEFIPQVFREIIEKYHPDGFADNSWAGLGSKEICYCENCRKQFMEAYGCKLPENADWEDPVYRKWIRWNYSLRVRNWHYFNEVTEKWGGKDCKWFGMLNADPFSTGGRFYDIKKLVQGVPFLFCDHQSRDSMGGFEQNSVYAALLRNAVGEDVTVAESMAHYYKGKRTFRLSSGERQEVRKWMLTGLSGGMAPWFHFVGGGTLDRRKFQISQDLYQWIAQNKTYFQNRENIASVGVVWNQETPVYYGRGEAQTKSAACFKGITESLSKAGIPFIPLHADDIETYKDKLELLILPNVAVLSAAAENAVCRWLEEGKDLILTGDTGLYDMEGEWKGAGPLYQKLGIRIQNELLGKSGMEQDNWMNQEGHNYLEICEGHPIWENTPDTEILPFGGCIRKAFSDGPLKPCAFLIPDFPIYPPEFAWIRERSREGAIYAGTLDSGSRVVYLAADLDRCYALSHVPDHRRVLKGIVEWAGRGNFPVRVKASAQVCCDAYRQKESLLISLVNLAGTNVPLGSLEENIPLETVCVTCRGKKQWKQAVSCISGERFQMDAQGEELTIRIPRLEEWDLLRVE